jgi:hypothetical protein
MTLAGFQLAARYRESGAQAGTLEVAPDEADRASVATASDVVYAFQRGGGSEVTGAPSASWVVLWTAPEGGGPIVFNAAANAADGDDSVSGDYVYTVEVVVE